jgi:hypothetical protein
VLEDGAVFELTVPKKLVWSHTCVFDNLAEQEGGDVASAMNRHSRPATIRMLELFVGASLPDFFEPHSLQDRDHCSRTQNGKSAHDYAEIVWIPTNSASSCGSPSSRSIATTS